jgi:hypothetical protein
MLFIKHEYDLEGVGLDVQPDVVFGPPHRRQRVVVAAQAMSRAVVQAVKVGETMGEEVQLVHVTLDPGEGERSASASSASCRACGWCWWSRPIGRSSGRSCATSRSRRPRTRSRLTIVLLPEHLPRHWWDRLLYNQNVHRIRAALVGRKDFVVLDTPYRRGM